MGDDVLRHTRQEDTASGRPRTLVDTAITTEFFEPFARVDHVGFDVWPIRPAHETAESFDARWNQCTDACTEGHTYRVGCVMFRDDLVRACAGITGSTCPGCHHTAHVAGGCTAGDGVSEGCACTVETPQGDPGSSWRDEAWRTADDIGELPVDLVGTDGWYGIAVRSIRLVAGPLIFLGGVAVGVRLGRAWQAGR